MKVILGVFHAPAFDTFINSGFQLLEMTKKKKKTWAALTYQNIFTVLLGTPLIHLQKVQRWNGWINNRILKHAWRL